MAGPCKTLTPQPADLRVVIIFDALDECIPDKRVELMNLLQDPLKFRTLAPEWLGFFITTRPEDYVESRFAKFLSLPNSTQRRKRTAKTFGPTSRTDLNKKTSASPSKIDTRR